ncbi:Trm112 family protein [Candidatus Woesearchaeota archaeon]|nr:Trm112 family protein [Candidatus Woesearchaeota archaeon]
MVEKFPISEELFNILACPVCKGSLKYTENKDGLRCEKCRHTYPIKDGIPVLLPPDMQ